MKIKKRNIRTNRIILAQCLRKDSGFDIYISLRQNLIDENTILVYNIFDWLFRRN